MGHLDNMLNSVKDKISEYKEASKAKEEKAKWATTKYEKVVDENGEVEDWYMDWGEIPPKR